MKKKRCCAVPILAKTLFPETYADAVAALLLYMPILKMPVMRENLVRRASFFTLLAIGLSDENNWDIKAEQGEEVSMCIFLPNEILPLSQKDSDEEARRCANRSYVMKVIADHARAFGSGTKKHPHHK